MDSVLRYFARLYIRIKNFRYGWHGNYSSWQQARQLCSGYNAVNILDKVKKATLKVKNGEAVYERDSILFSKIEYSWPLLANLLWIANKNNGRLSVIDFGGSLGTSYFQNRRYLQYLSALKWSVIEQDNFVAAGRQEIADEHLSFFHTIDTAMSENGEPDVLLISCVLPYIEKPFDLLKDIAGKKIPYIIVDNTYFNPRPANRLTIQKVPPVYYDAAYPAWFLDYNSVISVLGNTYDLVAEHTNEQFLYLYGEKIYYKGFLMQLKNA
jgi:putative methyltransferase (TIGR04325 family)